MTANRRGLVLLAATAACVLAACPVAPRHTIQISDLVAIGDSITMGIQDAGLLKSHQLNCYPYFVAQQMGQADGFQQPLVASPGIGVPPYETPLQIADGQIIADYLPVGINENELLTMVFGKLENAFYRDPYNNLGVNGARLYDLRYTTGYDHTYYSIANFFYDITLRNRDFSVVPNFGGKTMAEEAAMLQPLYILLWIGNNDALGYVLGGGEDLNQLTDPGKFKTEYEEVLTYLTNSCPEAKIVLATIPEYLPFGYALDTIFVSGSAKLFDPKTFLPIDFDDAPNGVNMYIEPENGGTIKHLLLTGAAAYLEQGAGIPANLTQVEKDKLTALGLSIPATAIPLTKDLVFTDTEEQATLEAIHDFNDNIKLLATEFKLPVVDANAFMKPSGGWDDSWLKFALISQDDTAYSLDGIHPNNFGHALIANEFIQTMNSRFGLSIPTLNPYNYHGQYSGKQIQAPALKSIRRLQEMYPPGK